MSAPLPRGHEIEKLERFWHEEEGRMRYMMTHRRECRRCLTLSTEELIEDFNVIQDASESFVIMVYPAPEGKWYVV